MTPARSARPSPPRRHRVAPSAALAVLALLGAGCATQAGSPAPTTTTPAGEADMFFKKKPDGLLAVGSPAPDFAVPDQDGKVRKLSDYKGRRVLLWFYPKADTPG